MDVLKIFARDTEVAERVAAASGVEAIVKAMKKWPKSNSVMKTVRALMQRDCECAEFFLALGS